MTRRAWAYHESARDAEAASDLKQAIALDWGEPPSGVASLVLHAEVLTAAGRYDEAKTDLASARSQSNDLAAELNRQAWSRLIDRPDRRASPASLVLARKAVALAPQDRSYLNTLALALYRNGRFAEARDVLRSSLAQGPWKFDCIDLFLLAMSHQRPGEVAASRAAFDRAALWRSEPADRPAAEREEIAGFEAEARRTLGLAR